MTTSKVNCSDNDLNDTSCSPIAAKETRTIEWTILKNFSLFSDIGDIKLQKIAALMREITFSPHEIICKENTPSDSMFFIGKGQVSVSYQEVLLATLNVGEYFGEMSLLEGRSRSATVRAMEEAVLYELPTNAFNNFIKFSPEALFHMVVTYDNRLRRDNRVVVDQFLELKNKYIELKEKNQQLLQTDKLASIGLITAGIAHEINNPLMILSGYTQLLEKNLIKIMGAEAIESNNIDDILRKIDKSIESIRRIVLGVKTYVRMDDEKTVPIRLNETIQGSIDLVSYLYKKEHISIVTDFMEKDIEVMGNVGQLQQVIINLLSNAKDAMEGLNNKKIIIKTQIYENNSLIQIIDNGPGISAENLPKIFNKFFTTKGVGKGTGLGLDIVKTIIDKMQGRINVESTEGQGATFTITVPIRA